MINTLDMKILVFGFVSAESSKRVSPLLSKIFVSFNYHISGYDYWVSDKTNIIVIMVKPVTKDIENPVDQSKPSKHT